MPALAPHASQSDALPGDATNVKIDMTENDGLDVIVAASGGSVSAPGGPAQPRCDSTRPRGSWEVDSGQGAPALVPRC